MKGLVEFEKDCREIDAVEERLTTLRKISRAWGCLTPKERHEKAQLQDRRQRLEGRLGPAAWDLRGEAWRLLAGAATTCSGPCREKAEGVAQRYRQHP